MSVISTKPVSFHPDPWTLRPQSITIFYFAYPYHHSSISTVSYVRISNGFRNIQLRMIMRSTAIVSLGYFNCGCGVQNATNAAFRNSFTGKAWHLCRKVFIRNLRTLYTACALQSHKPSNCRSANIDRLVPGMPPPKQDSIIMDEDDAPSDASTDYIDWEKSDSEVDDIDVNKDEPKNRPQKTSVGNYHKTYSLRGRSKTTRERPAHLLQHILPQDGGRRAGSGATMSLKTRLTQTTVRPTTSGMS